MSNKCAVNCAGCENGDPEVQKCISSQVEELLKQIEKMKNCYNCKKAIFDYEDNMCESNMDCKLYTNQSTVSHWELED